ncbi:MAG: response regulator transcription factor [Pseudomonadales bacterium]|nr:response regulator transcription factor [Pseudomonadales bacterium]
MHADLPLLPSPVLIVEDNSVMQERLRAILIMAGYPPESLFVAGDMARARAAHVEQPFAMALIDIRLPDGSGIDLIREWHEDDPALPILVVSAWSTGALIVSAIQAGATGYLLKQRSDDEITQAIHSALRGGAPIDPFVARHILKLVGDVPPVDAAPSEAPQNRSLTDRQIEILRLVNRGLTNKEIAKCLDLSHMTIATHIKSIYKKLAVSSRTEALFVGRAHGLLPRSP